MFCCHGCEFPLDVFSLSLCQPTISILSSRIYLCCPLGLFLVYSHLYSSIFGLDSNYLHQGCYINSHFVCIDSSVDGSNNTADPDNMVVSFHNSFETGKGDIAGCK